MAHHWPEKWPNVMNSDDLYTFDPNGSLLLQLPKTPLAEQSNTEEISLVQDESQELDNTRDTLPGAMSLPQPLFEQSRNDDAIDESLQLALEDNLVLDDTLSIYLRVSAGHLILASPVFGAMLDPDKFAEGDQLRSEGNLIIKLPDDPEALIILMHIIHGATRKVPRSITLDTLTKLAKLVDYYNLHETVEMFSDTWVKNLMKSAFPKSYTPDIIPWLFISWVFQKGDAFTQITQILIREGDDKSLDAIQHELIPIPPPLSNKIQEHRREAIERIITVVHDYIARYLTSEILCPNNRNIFCDANVLGSLLKNSAIIGLWPRPTVPYHGITFSVLARKIREMQVLDNCDQRDGYYSYSSNNHGVKYAISASIRSIEDQYCGLELDSFTPVTQGRMKDGTTTRKSR